MDSAGQPWPQTFHQLVVANCRYWLKRTRDDLSRAMVEIPQVLKALSYALSLSEAWESTRDLMLLVSSHVIRQGYSAEWESFLIKGIARSLEENDPAEIDLLLQLGTLYRLQGRLADAQRCFQKALTLCEQSDLRKHYWTLVNQLGLVSRLAARPEEALAFCQQILAEQSPSILERAEALNVMGLVAYDRRQWDVALDHFGEALNLYRSLNDTYQIARILNNRGLVLLRCKRWNEAEESHQQAIHYFQVANDNTERFKAVMNLGNTFLMRKDYHRAIQQYEEALPIFRQCHYIVDLAHTYNNLGMAHTALESWPMAEDYFRASIEAWRNLADPYNLANVLDNLGDMFLKANQPRPAREILSEALQVLNTVPDGPTKTFLQHEIEGRLKLTNDGLMT